jgi:hypothetical protein
LSEPYWLGSYKIGEIDNLNKFLYIDLSDDDYTKRILISSDYLVVSYNLTMGIDGNSFLIDLNTMRNVNLKGMVAYSFIDSILLEIGKDGLDKKGRYFESGEYNIEKNKYQRKSISR